jgi:hypothetical protein
MYAGTVQIKVGDFFCCCCLLACLPATARTKTQYGTLL